MAGVLLVFCYLIVPSVGAMLFAETIGPRLAIGWTMGTVVSALGVWLSLQLDLPTGATIVCTFGLVLILMGIARVLIPRKRPSPLKMAPKLPEKRCFEIADKAIVCYRCGTGTSDPVRRPAAVRPRRGRLLPLAALVLLVLLGLYLGQAGRVVEVPLGRTSSLAAEFCIAVAVVVLAVRIARRR